MKIATWNINGINRRLDLLSDWLLGAMPDVLCLQELKCASTGFPAEALEQAGYGAVWSAEGRWNGVAIIARDAVPVLTQLNLPGDDDDKQARYIEAAVAGKIIGSIYAPNGNPWPGPKFDYKLAWLDRLARHAGNLVAEGVPLILSGDINVAPEPIDIYETRSYDDNALVQPEARERYQSILKAGLSDVFRHFDATGSGYTFWDYRRRRWERNAGLRLDHILVNNKVLSSVRSIYADSAVRGLENASDHAPVWIEIET